MKKMRKLIPAFAMLLVSAIMMSTASFAWFTMNDVVEATGMQVQAKAAGNLLISKNPLSAADTAISVDFSNVAKTNLKPITYKGAGAWQAAGNSTKVDPLYGTVINGALEDVTPTNDAGDYFAEYEMWLATAGDEYTGKVTINLEAIGGAEEKIANAYTVAVFVADKGVAFDYTKPNVTYSYHQKVILSQTDIEVGTFTIPSTYGRTATDTVGLHVLVRIYVDGALETTPTVVKTRDFDVLDWANVADNVVTNYTATEGTNDAGETITTGYNITAVAKVYDAKLAELLGLGAKLYSKQEVTDAEGNVSYNYALIDTTTWTVGETNLEEQGVDVIWDGLTYLTESKTTTYVNNANVPVGGTTFAIEFKATEVVTPAEPEQQG